MWLDGRALLNTQMGLPVSSDMQLHAESRKTSTWRLGTAKTKSRDLRVDSLDGRIILCWQRQHETVQESWTAESFCVGRAKTKSDLIDRYQP
jgi:hypothetical protein